MAQIRLNKEEYYNITKWQKINKGESMEKRAIEKRVRAEWIDINMSELVQGDEFRYKGTEESFVVESAPFINNGVWTVEVCDGL